MKRALIGFLVMVCLGGCYPYRYVAYPQTSGPVRLVATHFDGSECVIRDGGLMDWAKGVPGAETVHHERWARIRVERGPYYASFPVCEAEESAGSRRGERGYR